MNGNGDTDREVFRVCLEKRVFLCLLSFAASERSGSRLLPGSRLGFRRLVIETKSALGLGIENNAASEL